MLEIAWIELVLAALGLDLRSPSHGHEDDALQRVDDVLAPQTARPLGLAAIAPGRTGRNRTGA